MKTAKISELKKGDIIRFHGFGTTPKTKVTGFKRGKFEGYVNTTYLCGGGKNDTAFVHIDEIVEINGVLVEGRKLEYEYVYI